MPLTCPSCSAVNSDTAVFCGACSLKLVAGDTWATGAQPVSVRSWLVGSGPDCDVVVPRPTVSRRHCRIVRTDAGYVLEDLDSRNGTYVNGVAIRAATAVSPSDRITVGQTEPFPWGAVLDPDPNVDIPDTTAGRHGLQAVVVGSSEVQRPRTLDSEAVGPGGVRVLTIGRAEGNDIVLDYPMVSTRHARILLRPDGATIEDLGSTNGTAVGRRENRVMSAPLLPDDAVYFGSFRIAGARLLAGPGGFGAGSGTLLPVRGGEVVFGRDPSAAEVLDSPMVSWRHARLCRSGNGATIEDLGSTNGTFLNGQPVSGVTPVSAGDVISIGSFAFKLRPDGGLDRRDFRGDVSVEVRSLDLAVRGKPLLEDVSLTIYPSEFVGLMGPSGAGKTTLMNAMNGYTPPSRGAVVLNGIDLYANYAQFCGHLGYVPQNDIMHGDLTVGQALAYTARLRLPRDYSRAGIRARVKSVLAELGLEAVENVLIGSAEKKGISGGQRKRVNLAMELLTDPSVLFLDEPTSGLSSEDTLMVMRLLRKLADSGKTILLTIHQPSLEAFRLMDDIVIVSKDRGSAAPGRLAYFGPAYPDSVNFFNPDGVPGLKPGAEPLPDEVLRGLSTRPTDEWAARFAASRYRREFVDERAGRSPTGRAVAVAPKIPRKFGVRQWATLVRRSLSIKRRDVWNTAILLAQAPIIALMIVFVFGDKVADGVAANASPADWLSFSGAAATSVFLMAISAIWFGCSNAAREIVGEWAIYHRERMVNLKVPSYVASKLAVLGALCFVQCLVLLGIVWTGCGLKGSFGWMLGLLVLASLAGLGLGLTVSALARTSEVAIALIPLILIPMVIAGGMMKPVHEMNAPMQVFAGSMASRWAFEGMLLLESEARAEWAPAVPPGADAVREDLAERYFPEDDERLGVEAAAGVLAGMIMFLVIAIGVILRWRDVH